MSRFLDSTPSLFPSSKGLTKSASLLLSQDIDKYAIMNESGSARNLSKLNLQDSIYDEGDPGEVQYLLYLL